MCFIYCLCVREQFYYLHWNDVFHIKYVYSCLHNSFRFLLGIYMNFNTFYSSETKYVIYYVSNTTFYIFDNVDFHIMSSLNPQYTKHNIMNIVSQFCVNFYCKVFVGENGSCLHQNSLCCIQFTICLFCLYTSMQSELYVQYFTPLEKLFMIILNVITKIFAESKHKQKNICINSLS